MHERMPARGIDRHVPRACLRRVRRDRARRNRAPPTAADAHEEPCPLHPLDPSSSNRSPASLNTHTQPPNKNKKQGTNPPTRPRTSARAAAALVLLLLCGLPDRNNVSYRRLSAGGYYTGALLPLLAVLGLELWASFDFNAFWAWLHYTFIPDGIFSIHEPVMALFSEPLFAAYARPVGITLAFCTAALMVWPIVALTIYKTRKRRLEKRMGTGNR